MAPKPSRRDSCRGPELRFLGGAEGIRTPDPLHAMEVRYQLRYSPARPEGRTVNVEDLTLP